MIDGKIRRLHPVECARIMGFADDFQLHDRPNVSYKQFGNSVAVPVVSKIVLSIFDVIKDCSLEAAWIFIDGGEKTSIDWNGSAVESGVDWLVAQSKEVNLLICPISGSLHKQVVHQVN